MVSKLIRYALQSSKHKKQIQQTSQSILGRESNSYVNKKIHKMIDVSNVDPNTLAKDLRIMAEQTSKPDDVDRDDVKACKVLLNITQRQYLRYHSKFVGTLETDFDRFKAAVVVFVFTFILVLVIAKKYKLNLKDAFNPLKLKDNYEKISKQSPLIAKLYVIAYLAMIGSGFTMIKEKLLKRKSEKSELQKTVDDLGINKTLDDLRNR